MLSRKSILAGVSVAAMFAFPGSAFAADQIVGKVAAWNAATGIVTLGDKTVVDLSKVKDTVPAGLAVGDTIVINYEGSENGVDKVTSVVKQ